MAKRVETSARNQLAEHAAVYIIGKRNCVADPLEPIKWIRERKLCWVSADKTEIAIWFLFWINNEAHTMTTVEVMLKLVGKNWVAYFAELTSEYQPGKPTKEEWHFSDGLPTKVE